MTQTGASAGDADISYRGEGTRCIVRLQAGDIDITDESTDFFAALCKVRLQLECHGLLLACYGGSRTVFPSGMCRDMGAGLRAYRLALGQHAHTLVDIFDRGPDVEPATVKQQHAFHLAWIHSSKPEIAPPDPTAETPVTHHPGNAQAGPMDDIFTVCCACLGGVAGHLGFRLLAEHGFYAIVLPGGLLGLAAGIPRSRSITVPVMCGLLAVVAGLLTEYWFAPFVVDSSLNYFVLHAGDLRPVTLALIGLGGLIGFWVPFRRRIVTPTP